MSANTSIQWTDRHSSRKRTLVQRKCIDENFRQIDSFCLDLVQPFIKRLVLFAAVAASARGDAITLDRSSAATDRIEVINGVRRLKAVYAPVAIDFGEKLPPSRRNRADATTMHGRVVAPSIPIARIGREAMARVCSAVRSTLTAGNVTAPRSASRAPTEPEPRFLFALSSRRPCADFGFSALRANSIGAVGSGSVTPESGTVFPCAASPAPLLAAQNTLCVLDGSDSALLGCCFQSAVTSGSHMRRLA